MCVLVSDEMLCSLDPRPFPPPAINIRVTFEPCAELRRRRPGRFSSRDAWHGRHHYALRLTRAIVNVMLRASECERLCTSVRASGTKSCITDGLHVFPHAASKITFTHVPRARETRNFKPCGATSLCVVVLSLEGTAAPVEWLRD